jgi:hypothetical protein
MFSHANPTVHRAMARGIAYKIPPQAIASQPSYCHTHTHTDKWFPKPSVCTSNQLARAAAGSHHVGGEAPPLLQPPQEGRGAARRRVRVLRDRGGHRHRRGRVREVQEGGEGAQAQAAPRRGRRHRRRRLRTRTFKYITYITCSSPSTTYLATCHRCFLIVLVLRADLPYMGALFPPVQYEKHEAKKDPEHAHRHKITEEVAAAAAVGAGGYVFHEHHEKKKDHKDAEEASGEKKHHHLFG